MPYAPEHDEVPNPLRPGLRADSAPDPCAVVIFGGSGDLAHRKLVPALYNLAVGAHLPAALGIVGVSKSEYTHEEFAGEMREAVGKFSRTKPVDPEIWQDFAAGMRYVAGSFDDPDTFARLRTQLEELRALHARQPALLLRHAAQRVPDAAQTAEGRRHDLAAFRYPVHPGGDREAVRARSAQRARPQPAGAGHLR